MSSKELLMEAALAILARDGFDGVTIRKIADYCNLSVAAPYKHFKNKQAIFDSIIDEMNRRYEEQAGLLNINGTNPAADVNVYMNVSEDDLVEIGINLFLYFLHDDYTSRFRKILTIEQFHNEEFAKIYSDQYVNGPLSYQGEMFKLMVGNGAFADLDTDAMTLQFYSPIYMLLTLCDREPEREAEALKLLEKHIRQFSLLYGGRNEDSNA